MFVYTVYDCGMCEYVLCKYNKKSQNLQSQAVLDVLNFVMNEQTQPGVEPPTKYMQHDHGKYFTFFRHTYHRDTW